MLRFVGILLSFAGWGLAQQYPFVPITVPNSPQGVKVLLQDRAGRLWVGTTTGVACFDGSRFFNLREFGYPEIEALSLAEDDEGGLWIGSRLGLHRFSKGKAVLIRDGVVRSVIRAAPGLMLAAIGPAGKGIAQSADLFRVRMDGNAEQVPNLGVVEHLLVGADKSISFAGLHSWYQILPGSVTDWKPGANLAVVEQRLPDMGVEQVMRDRSGCWWFRNQGVTAYQCPADLKLQSLPVSISDGQKLMSEANDGRMLLPGQASFAIGRPGSFQVAKPANGLPPIEAAIMTRDGSIWIGGAKGLFRFAYPFRFEFWNERDGLGDVNSTLRIRDIIFAADGDGVKELSRDRRTWSALPKLPDLGRPQHIIAGPGDTIYAALFYHGVEQIGLDGTSINRPAPGGLGMHLAKTPDGTLWVAGIGISRVVFADGLAKLYEEPLPAKHWNGLDNETNPINGDLWACYEGGLIKKTSTGWQSVTEKEGLLQNGCRSIAVSRNGDVWYGYNTEPAFSLVRPQANGSPPLLKHFRSGGDVGDALVHFLDVDHRGWLWRGASDGVYVSNSSEAEQGKWLHLSEGDGLPALDTNQQGFYDDSDGSVWFGVNTSLVHFTPPPTLLEPLPTSVFLSAFSWDGTSPRMAEAMESIPNRAKLTAHVGSLQFDRRNALRLRYRILPEQTAWKESRNLDLSLGVLPWGSHRLEVQANLLGGNWSQTIAYPLNVLRPVWLSLPAIIGFVFVPIAGVLGSRVWSEKRRRRERKALPDLTELRMATLVPEAQALIGIMLDGRFTPKHLLARGGFATVFDGHDSDRNRRCAIKVFHREVADQGLAKRFQQEVTALETIAHPNVVRLYGHGTTPSGVPYLVMEFIEGTTLRDALPVEGFERARVASLLRQAGNALGAIHNHGIYHRDFKPENLMIRSASGPDEDLVLIDFSIAIVKSPDESLHGLSRAAGTFHYMAPEQAVGFADSTSDVYSLAKVIMEMLTGKRLSELLPEAALDLPAKVRDLLVGLPFGLSATSIDLICAALEFDPSRRPAIAVQFASQIAGDLESS